MYDNDFEIKENKTWIKDKTDPPNIFNSTGNSVALSYYTQTLPD